MKIKISSTIAMCAALAFLVLATSASAVIHPPSFVVRKKTAPSPASTPIMNARPTPPAPTPVKTEPVRVSRPIGTVPSDISPEAAEVVWLYHKGLGNGELLHYVNRSHADFKLSVKDVNYLSDIGVASPVVFAMLRDPSTREDVVRLRNRLPQYRPAKMAKTIAIDSDQPQAALDNSQALENTSEP